MAFMLGSCQQKLQAEPAKSNNLFLTLLGKSEAEVQARVDSIWTHFFRICTATLGCPAANRKMALLCRHGLFPLHAPYIR